jgi:hypothetical protein
MQSRFFLDDLDTLLKTGSEKSLDSQPLLGRDNGGGLSHV